jgi:hypothetical protein
MGRNGKQLAVAAGICTIVGAVTAYSAKRKWEDIHTAAVVIGAIVMIVGAAS